MMYHYLYLQLPSSTTEALLGDFGIWDTCYLGGKNQWDVGVVRSYKTGYFFNWNYRDVGYLGQTLPGCAGILELFLIGLKNHRLIMILTRDIHLCRSDQITFWIFTRIQNNLIGANSKVAAVKPFKILVVHHLSFVQWIHCDIFLSQRQSWIHLTIQTASL